jgi:aerobic-type carbon monoxide dehydrogenase small subunit (CoxS/CutS family)
MAAVKFTLNGKAQTVDAVAAMPLRWVLRDTLGMEGTQFGCAMALCGACTERERSQFLGTAAQSRRVGA